MNSSRRLSLLIAAACLIAALTGCGSDDSAAQVETLAVPAGLGFDGITVGDSGTIFVSDLGDFTEAGTTISAIEPDGSTAVFSDQVNRPLSLDLDSDGNLIVMQVAINDFGQPLAADLVAISPSGAVTVLTEVVGGGGVLVEDKTITFTEHSIVESTGDASPDEIEYESRLVQLDGNGERIELASARTIGVPGKLRGPGIGRASNGDIYISDYLSAEIVKVSPNGTMETLVVIEEALGPDGYSGYDAGLGDLVVVGESIYVTGAGSGMVYRVEADGSYQVVAGTGDRAGQVDGDALTASFVSPNRLGFDEDNNRLVISEYSPPSVRVVNLGT